MDSRVSSTNWKSLASMSSNRHFLSASARGMPNFCSAARLNSQMLRSLSTMIVTFGVAVSTTSESDSARSRM